MSESGVERAERDILELSVEDRDELMDRVVPPWIEGLPAAKRERMGEIFERTGESEAAGEVDWTAAAVDRPIPDAVVAIGSAPIVPAGEVGMLAGFGGAGKSRLIAQIAVAAAGTADGELTPVLHPHTASVGRPGIGDALQVRGGPVVAVGYEDAAPWVRLRAAGAALWLDGGEPGPCSAGVDDPKRLSMAVLDQPLFAPPGRDLAPAPTPKWRAVFDRASEIGARLVVVDPVSLAWDAGAEGYGAEPVNACIAALRAEAVRLGGAAILLVAHLPKAARMKRTADAGDVSGSGAWVDRVRGVLMLTGRKDEDDGGRKAPPWLGVAKANYCKSGDDVGWPLAPVMDGGRPLAWEAENGEAQDGAVIPVTVA